MSDDKIHALIESLVNERTGINVQVLGDGYLQRCIQSGLKKTGIKTLYNFYELLKTDTEFWNDFVEEISVSETWFFRDTQAFVALRSHVQKKLKEITKHKPLRILSLPCSSGEEPYSIAMTLLQMGMSSEQWVIHAIDINNSNLEKAKKGIYKASSFRSDDKTVQNRFFTQDKESFKISADIKKNIIFAKKNIFDLDELNLQPFDIIFCRNLFIYFNRERAQQGLKLLESILIKDGLLFVGHAETIHVPQSKFTSLPTTLSFAYQYTHIQVLKNANSLANNKTLLKVKAQVRKNKKTIPIVNKEVNKEVKKETKKEVKKEPQLQPNQSVMNQNSFENNNEKITETAVETNEQAETVMLNDCWNKIGSWSQQALCERLRDYHHCRNCSYYASETRKVLKRIVSPQQKSEWAKVYANKVENRELGNNVATLFRVADRWLAVSTKAVNEVITWRLIRSIPRKNNPVLLGIVNVHGELKLCVSLAKMLNLKTETSNPQFFIVFNNGENQVACPVDEVKGNIRYHSEQLHDVPGHWNEQSRSFSQGFLQMDDMEIVRLEEQNIFASVWDNEA